MPRWKGRSAGLPWLLAVIIVLGACGGAQPAAPPTPEPTPNPDLAAKLDLEPAVRSFLAALPQDWGLVAPKDVAASRPFLVDVRQPDAYKAGFIQGAVNVPLRELARSISALPGTDKQIVVVAESEGRGAIGMAVLGVLGYKASSLAGGIIGWKDAGLPLVTSPAPGRPAGPAAKVDPALQAALDTYLRKTLGDDFGLYDPAGFATALAYRPAQSATGLPESYDPGPPLVVDVREPAEASAAQIAKTEDVTRTIAMPLRTLPDNLKQIPWQKPVVQSCGVPIVLDMDRTWARLGLVADDGHRAALAMVMLQLLGFRDVHALDTGIKTWQGS